LSLVRKTGNFQGYETISETAHATGVGSLIRSQVYQYLLTVSWVPRLFFWQLLSLPVLMSGFFKHRYKPRLLKILNKEIAICSYQNTFFCYASGLLAEATDTYFFIIQESKDHRSVILVTIICTVKIIQAW